MNKPNAWLGLRTKIDYTVFVVNVSDDGVEYHVERYVNDDAYEKDEPLCEVDVLREDFWRY